ncbi:MAG TPA: hypothetical protein VMZ28_18885 [Kofleriaceae bacterium]|nr:hypothetical protein [Kofleriaceae bacterium]
MNLRALAASLFLLVSLPSIASANERHFTYTYESAVLPVGGKEIEIWTTPRIGKENYFVRFDQRLEFEVGVSDNLMTAFYLNAETVTADVAGAAGLERVTESELAGVSNEWKLKLSDPVADSVGMALYGEISVATAEAELEAKLIIDKKVGDLMFAGNLVLANETEFEREGDESEVEQEQEVEIDLALGYFIAPGVSAGLELRNHNEMYEGEWLHSALFAGPTIAYASEAWWIAASVMPQLPALKDNDDSADDGARVLDAHEKLEARVLFSMHVD